MSDDLRWSWCNNDRSKVYNKCNVLESSQNLPSHPQSVERLSSMKLVPGAQWGLLWYRREHTCWLPRAYQLLHRPPSKSVNISYWICAQARPHMFLEPILLLISIWWVSAHLLSPSPTRRQILGGFQTRVSFTDQSDLPWFCHVTIELPGWQQRALLGGRGVCIGSSLVNTMTTGKKKKWGEEGVLSTEHFLVGCPCLGGK